MATATATARPVPSLAPPPKPRRPRVLFVGTAFTSAAVVMGFLGLIALYVTVRQKALADTGAWLPDGAVIPLTAPNVAMATLLMSAVTLQWAIYAVGNRDRTNAYLALGLTLLLGLAFANSTAYLYSQMGLVIADSAPGVLIYAISGAHLVLTASALLFIGVVALRALGGEYTPRDHEGMSAAALFWYATIAVYAVIWYTIFITK